MFDVGPCPCQPVVEFDYDFDRYNIACFIQTNTKVETIKRTKAIKFLTVILSLCYLVCLTIGLVCYKPFADLWFSLFLFFVASLQVFVGICFYRDSAILFSFCCFACSISGFLVYYFGLNQYAVQIYFSFICFAFFCLYLIFRQNIHLKMFAIIFCQVVLLVVTKIFKLNHLYFWIVQTSYLSVIICLFIVYLCRTKESKGGIRKRKKRV